MYLQSVGYLLLEACELVQSIIIVVNIATSTFHTPALALSISINFAVENQSYFFLLINPHYFVYPFIK